MASMLNPSNHPPEQQYTLLFLKQLIRSHPLACLGGLWVSLVLVASMATLGLFNPGSVDREDSNPTPTLETIQESTPQSTEKKDLPLALFGAVALGCAGGSFLITQALRQATKRSYHPAKHSKPVATVRKKQQHPSKKRRPLPSTPQPATVQKDREEVSLSTPTLPLQEILRVKRSYPDGRKQLQQGQGSKSASPRDVASLTRIGDRRNHNPSSVGMDNGDWLSSFQISSPQSQVPATRSTRLSTPTLPLQGMRGEQQPKRRMKNPSSRAVPPIKRIKDGFGSKSTSQTVGDRTATTREKLTHVTVLSPQESHPLDGRQESLADLLDLRKHHSLSSLMRGKSLR